MAGRIAPRGFYIVSSVLLAIALVAAVGRTVLRLQRLRRLYVDDGFLFLAVAFLIAGTVLLDLNAAPAYEQVQVEAGAEVPPPNLVDTLIQDQNLQVAATCLIGLAIFAVKFSFLSFFHMLIRRTNNWYRIWWWVVFFITLGSAPIVVFSDLISCPYSGMALLTECVSPSALERENATLKASISLDIISDVFIISIPVIILWRLQTSLRKKAILAASLCLGVFMIICAAVRIGTSSLPGGQVDTVWALMWEQIEACVAVTVVSFTAFRTLFVSNMETTVAPAPGIATRREWYEIGNWSRRPPRDSSKTRTIATQASEDQTPSVVSRELALIEGGDARAAQNFITATK